MPRYRQGHVIAAFAALPDAFIAIPYDDVRPELYLAAIVLADHIIPASTALDQSLCHFTPIAMRFRIISTALFQSVKRTPRSSR